MVKGENIGEERPYGIVELSTEQNITVPIFTARIPPRYILFTY